MRKILLTVAIIAGLIGVGLLVTKLQDDNTNTDTTASKTVEMSNSSGVKEREGSRYLAYSPEILAASETDTNILFFKASWCPTCRILDADIQENLGKIPEDVTIFSADYDSEKELKSEYKVAAQHTLVILDDEGNEQEKWSAILSLEDLLKVIES